MYSLGLIQCVLFIVQKEYWDLKSGGGGAYGGSYQATEGAGSQNVNGSE